jgi:hypothetical protein
MTLAELIDEVVSEVQADTAGAAYPWEELVNSALQETESTTRPARIAQAETIVYARRLALKSREGSREERELIEAAIDQLASLRGDKA